MNGKKLDKVLTRFSRGFGEVRNKDRDKKLGEVQERIKELSEKQVKKYEITIDRVTILKSFQIIA